MAVTISVLRSHRSVREQSVHSVAWTNLKSTLKGKMGLSPAHAIDWNSVPPILSMVYNGRWCSAEGTGVLTKYYYGMTLYNRDTWHVLIHHT